jgi:hypothetical protein
VTSPDFELPAQEKKNNGSFRCSLALIPTISHASTCLTCLNQQYIRALHAGSKRKPDHRWFAHCMIFSHALFLPHLGLDLDSQSNVTLSTRQCTFRFLMIAYVSVSLSSSRPHLPSLPSMQATHSLFGTHSSWFTSLPSTQYPLCSWVNEHGYYRAHLAVYLHDLVEKHGVRDFAITGVLVYGGRH